MLPRKSRRFKVGFQAMHGLSSREFVAGRASLLLSGFMEYDGDLVSQSRALGCIGLLTYKGQVRSRGSFSGAICIV